ncbi:MAG: amino acid adenylation domain-containing protein [Candidatus Eremiobacteraeota bacterium]|nr:amino acid adenylation domain-containing protein [Candidatus Eremiobacteraeota bacterium]
MISDDNAPETATQRRVSAQWNGPEAPYRDDCSTVDLVREQAERTPDAIALAFEDSALTYAELDARANLLGSYLRARGAGPEVRVAIILERSLEMVVAVLGVQRAGAAFVPIDTDYPNDRIAFMLSDSEAAIIVTQEALRDRLPPSSALFISVDGDRAAIAAASPQAPHIEADAGRLAHVIYTSGSTGRPKGVAIEQRNVVNFLQGIRSAVEIGCGDTLIAIAPLSFDISGVDIFLPLMSGARVVIASRETAVNPKALIALMERMSATHLQATPTTWRMLLEAGWRGRDGFTSMSTGETLPQKLAEQLLQRVAMIWNLYGPTEATYATMERIKPGEPVTIGRPLPNVSIYVLDSALQPMPVGARGELYIGGAGITRGYLNRAELTAERFVQDPFRGAPAHMYRSGDLARFRPDGRIEYLGRADFQVKVRGYRIEPGEIESVLEQRSDVRSAVVVVREKPSGESSLVAYVAATRTKRVSPVAVRRELAATLPAYMVPDTVVVLDELPVTANGKIDRGGLPAPPPQSEAERERRSIVEPRTPLESELRAIWEDVLDVRPIGTTDDFFELGVSSIVAARLFDRIERDLGTKLPLSPLFQAPTIGKLAALIDGRVDRSSTSLVPIQPHGSQTPIFCIHGGAGTILHFQPLSKRLGPNQPFYGLQMKGLYGDAAPERTVESMARHYLREIRTVQRAGPYVLAGYCFGGMVAAEMARQLKRAGERVALLVMFNGATPAYVKRYGAVTKGPPAKTERPRGANRWRAALRELRPQRLRYRVKFKIRLTALRERVRNAMGLPIPAARRELAFLQICYLAMKRYHPKTVCPPMLIFKGEGLYHEDALGWEQFAAGGIEVIELPGHHKSERDTMREPHAETVSVSLREALERHGVP